MTYSAPSSEDGIDHLPVRLHGFALMHVAMRRDAGRAVRASRRLTPTTAKPVGAWWRRFQAVVEHHHRAEDQVFWPALAARVPSFTTASALADDHLALDHAMAALSDALAPAPGAATEAAQATEAAVRFESLLRDHLRKEEAAVFPAATEMPAAEYERIEDGLARSAPFPVLSFLQPWMFDGADADAVRRVSATIPLPARVLGRTVWRLQYDRLVAPVRAAAAAG